MYEIIARIEERAYNTAIARGKDVSHTGCAEYMGVELAEFWAAVEAGKEATMEMLEIAQTHYDSGNYKTFVEYYSKYIHNTRTDEMADMVIVAATWIHGAREQAEAAGETFIPGKSISVLMASGAVQFVSAQIAGMHDVNMLMRCVDLKMNYNAERND